MTARILLVDDDEALIAGLLRILNRHFTVETALGSAEALRLVAADGPPFAVVIADLNMPGLNGIQLLQKVEAHAPATVRLMLTGEADLAMAKKAVNEGHIYRFLTKPCPPSDLVRAIQDGVSAFERSEAERHLLDETFRGAIKVLTDVLAVANPGAFGRTQRIRRLVRALLLAMRRDLEWDLDVAVMLSQLGTVALPTEILDKALRGAHMTAEEQRRFERHTEITWELLQPIPRLERVREIIRWQCAPLQPEGDALPAAEAAARERAIPFGARVLKVALDFDSLTGSGLDGGKAFTHMEARAGCYDPEVVAALRKILGETSLTATQPLAVKDLKVGMVLSEAVTTRDGLLLVARGSEVTPALLEKLRCWSEIDRVLEPLVVRILGPCAPSARP